MTIEKYFKEWNVEVVNEHLQLVELHTVELIDRTGNKVKLTYNISPYEWIYREYMRSYNKCKSFKIKFDVGDWILLIFFVFLFICFMFINKFLIVFSIGIGVLVFAEVWPNKQKADKILDEFETLLKLGALPPDWEKSLQEYYGGNDILISSANIFLQMRHMDILEIKIDDLKPGKRLSVKHIEKNGDVYEKYLDFNSFYNVNIQHPTVIMIPEAVSIKLPIDINKTGETDNQVLLTNED